ncbi:3'(2'),5'-bisphosphate nucleotidase CysQ [Roseibacterium sp. SDUM158017]|uniref:inositol monophosphatase family protein n=1 Tax=Roseicyclus salinarum TaxID=3036773 RepID=UPI0024156E3D|nr:3'(2'),5'-bisphosphate nucleotidase CysQ [Roseibacterium sp. SDUM158017]MDG4646822.1 3'(2'),5'-bisphosphate nucleotidase CysQ [Roseibacterium sp. SDUM158017]
MPGPEADLALLVEAAQVAGDIARTHFRRDPEIWTKGDDSPVTEADIAIDRVLRTDLLAARPDYGWLSEETEDDAARLRSERVFIVDPIDGTRAFIDGQTSFAHSIAIAEAGEIVAGVVYLPMKDKLYAAARGSGCTLNGQAVRASSVEDERGARILATKPNVQPKHWPGGVPPFERVYRPSLAYRMALVAEGHFDGMVTFRDTWEWDIAAGVILVQEAGGAVTDGRGETVWFNAPVPQAAGVMAGPATLHRTLLRRRMGV